MKAIFFIITLISFNFLLSQNLHLDSSLKKINVKIEKIDTTRDWDAVNNYEIENFSSNNATLKTYNKKGEIVKMVFEANYSTIKKENVYYFDNDFLIYAFEKEISNIISNDIDDLASEQTYKSYFEEEKLMRQFDSSDAGCLFSNDYLKAAGSSIVDEVGVLKSLIVSGAKF
ncbi:hypothetical protein H0I23_02075 [Cellulophaga sp. HaHaR_3_176]|uniref:hypothetical protein n=1 Tax=Cellulophaga sp. HaHaR_3_176 TaxID=1942464 RepID=UPI001C1F8812|nr:hypothetical protein [Cellulophaga sp. HaHaR_3_176]QWX84459.1 hypothetical protein H0I23_02075 [Cellulophaga sp. HaHaR_3_176]